MTHEPFQKGCPWFSLTETFGLPDVIYCEEYICGLFITPSLALSNFLYILIAVYIFLNSRSKLDKHFSYIFFCLGTCSFIYHSTNNGLTQFLDNFGIFVTLSFIQLSIAQRFYKESKLFFILPLLILCVCYPLFLLIGVRVQIISMIYAPIVVLQELFLLNREDQNRFIFYLSIILLIFANTFNLLDVKKVACDPKNHFFQFHSLWHILSALGVYYYYVYLSRIFVFKDDSLN